MRSIRATDNPAEMIRIAMELLNRLPQLEHNKLFAASIPLVGCLQIHYRGGQSV